MQKVCKQLLVFLSFTLTICCQDCNPLYLRLFYDPYSDPALKVDMIVMFNTFAKCSDSYIKANYLNSQAQFACTVNMIQIVEQNKIYLQQWVHTCDLQLDSPSQIDSFNYRVQGGQENTNFSLVQLTSDSLPFIAVVTANLNFLNDKKYLPFAEAFQELLSRRTTQISNNEGLSHYRINAMIINGGFAENLIENHGNNFNKIMTLLGQFSNRWPMLLNIGPKEINNLKYFSLIKDCFVLGGLQGDQSTGMQSYSFSRKANIILLQANTQQSGTNQTWLPHFQQTLSSLSSFLKESQAQSNQFTIAFNHYGLVCNNSDNNQSNHSCDKGTAPLFDLLTGSNGQSNKPIDLYVEAYKDDYERNYPIKNGSYETEEDFIFDRGEFIELNQGVGKMELHSQHDSTKSSDKVIYRVGKPGFGIITIRGNGDLLQNASLIQMKQNLVRKIQKEQSHNFPSGELEHKDTNQQVLDEAYLRNQDLNELDLFLLNYKHITINGTQLLVEDVFRIITPPLDNPPVLPVLRHHLRVA